MNLDELPISVLLILAAVAWLALGMLELQRHRVDDRHARRAAHRVLSESREHGSTDHNEQQHEADADADEVAEDHEERCAVHGRSVHPASMVMSQG